MSQFNFGTIDPNVKTGTELAADLNQWRDALHTTHAGVARPAYATPGLLWVDQTSASDWKLKMATSTGDVLIGGVNPTTNQRTPTLNPDGTVAAPSIAFASEPGLGLYRPSAGYIGMVGQGFHRFTFDAGSATATLLGVWPRTGPGRSEIVLSNHPTTQPNRSVMHIYMAETEAVIASWADGTGPTLPIVYNATAHSFTGGQVSVANQINATGPVGLVMSGAGQNQQWFAKGNAGGTTPMEGSFWLDPGLQAAIQFNCDGQLFRLRSTGNADKAVAGQWNGLSDIRLKEDVAPLSYGLDEILKLNPITFRLKDRNRKFGDGPLNVSVSAQDAEAVMPQMVYREPDEKLGEILGIRPDFIQYALVNAVKTLNERIAKLEGA